MEDQLAIKATCQLNNMSNYLNRKEEIIESGDLNNIVFYVDEKKEEEDMTGHAKDNDFVDEYSSSTGEPVELAYIYDKDKLKNACARCCSNGSKFDSDKDRWDLLPLEPIEQVVKVLTMGAKKYAPNNWQGVEMERYVAALFRHIIAWRKGEIVDSESGLHHLAHAITNLVFIMEIEKKNGRHE